MRERRRLILKEVVDRYIKTRRPVSSKELLEAYGHRWSSATIRNELAALEREGYLYKPSPSAGRIPTAKGFRYFARWLLELSSLRREEVAELAEPFGFAPREVREVLRLGAHVLATVTEQLGFVIPPPIEELKVARPVLLWGRSCVRVWIHTEPGLAAEYVVRLSQEYTPAEVSAAEEILARILRGKSLREAISSCGRLTSWYERPQRLVHELLGAIRPGRPEAFFAGWERLPRAFPPEGPLLEEVLRLLAETRRFAELILGARGNSPGTEVHVGDLPGLPAVAVVSAPFYRATGVVGVLGPLWLDYARAISAVRYVGGRLSGYLEFLGRMSLPEEVMP